MIFKLKRFTYLIDLFVVKQEFQVNQCTQTMISDLPHFQNSNQKN